MLLFLAQQAPEIGRQPEYDWWYIGLGIGFTIVVVVVILVATILTLAQRIGAQARTGIGAMDELRVATLPVWELQKANSSITRIWRAAEAARGVLRGVLNR
jgi:hypothetical protein